MQNQYIIRSKDNDISVGVCAKPVQNSKTKDNDISEWLYAIVYGAWAVACTLASRATLSTTALVSHCPPPPGESHGPRAGAAGIPRGSPHSWDWRGLRG